MPKAQKNPGTVTDKWVTNIGQATPSITTGVNAVTEAPGAKAAAQKDKMRTKFLASIDSGKWESRVGAVPLGEWKANTISAIPNIAAGAQRKKGKYMKFATEFLPVAAQVSQQVAGMPHNTVEDAVARSAAAIRAFAAWGAARK